MANSAQKSEVSAKAIVLQHIQCETPGIIRECLRKAGIDAHFVRTFEKDPVPSDLHDRAGLIVMGGPMSVYDQAQFPFLLDEQRLIEAALKDDKPVLGVCLGSQLLAATLGAEVKGGTQKEIGWYPVTLKEPTATDSLWKDLPDRFTAYHWHGDVFELPQDAVSLASSEMTPCQAFRHGKHAYGFLFHMEVTEDIIKNMTTEFQDELAEQHIEAKLIIQKAREHLSELQTIGRKVFGRWVKSLQPD